MPRDVTQLVAQDIHQGRLGPGSWLKQIDLERRYAATRADVRQALDRLVQKGVVRHLANRGYQVEEFDAARIEHIMAIRAVLEVAAAAEVIFLPTDLAAMRGHAQAFADALEAGTVEAQEAANLAFHTAMLAPCPNRELVALLFDLRARVPIDAMRRRNTMEVLRRGAWHHFEIIRLIEARDLPALQQVMREHNLSPG